jgi:hypothetical protein
MDATLHDDDQYSELPNHEDDSSGDDNDASEHVGLEKECPLCDCASQGCLPFVANMINHEDDSSGDNNITNSSDASKHVGLQKECQLCDCASQGCPPFGANMTERDAQSFANSLVMNYQHFKHGPPAFDITANSDTQFTAFGVCDIDNGIVHSLCVRLAACMVDYVPRTTDIHGSRVMMTGLSGKLKKKYYGVMLALGWGNCRYGKAVLITQYHVRI